MSSVMIVSTVAGSFTIDAKGIRSNKPVLIESAIWNAKDGILTLRGYPNGKSLSPKNSYSSVWSDLNIKEPRLTGLGITESGTYKVSCPLSDKCDLRVLGSGSIKIDGYHDTHINAIVTGSGSIKGTGTVSRITATVDGSGKISGFLVTTMVRALVTNSGYVKLHRLPECKVYDKIDGWGKLSIKESKENFWFHSHKKTGKVTLKYE